MGSRTEHLSSGNAYGKKKTVANDNSGRSIMIKTDEHMQKKDASIRPDLPLVRVCDAHPGCSCYRTPRPLSLCRTRRRTRASRA